MNSLEELRRRKAELKEKIEQQRLELQHTFLEVRQEIEPANLLKKAVSGMFSFTPDKQSDGNAPVFERLPASLRFLIDLLVKDSRWALLLKFLAPVAIGYWPTAKKASVADVPETEATAPEPPKKSTKAKIYGGLRQSVANLRESLHKKDKEPLENPPEPTEN